MDASVNISEGKLRAHLDISTRKGLISKKHIIKSINLELLDEDKHVTYEISKRGGYNLRKKIDFIVVPKFDLGEFIENNDGHLAVSYLSVSKDGNVEKLKIEGENVNLTAERRDYGFRVSGEIEYPETCSLLIRHYLRILEEDSGLNISKYIDEALKGEDWKK